MQPKVPLLNYAPDADPTTPGIITNCANFIPTLKGYRGAPAPSTGTLSTALAANCQGAVTLRKLDDTSRTFAGTGVALYEAAATSWTDRTRASGAYTAGSDLRWTFAQFGDVSLASIKSDTLQASTNGAFSNVTGAPKASIVETAENFVFLFDTNEVTYGDSPNRWWCCARGDHTDWTPSVSTQSATGTLTSIPGKITAAKRYGNGIVVFKQKGMYIGTYVSPQAAIWDFQEVPGDAGSQSNEAVINIGTADDPKLIFMGFDDFYLFDGARPVSLGTNLLKETVFAELNKQYAQMCRAVHDRINSRVYFYYPSSGQITPDKCVVYNYKSNKWGRDDRSVQACFEYITPGVTYDDLGTLYSTYNDFPNVSYDSSFWTAGFPAPAIINTSKVLQTLNGNSTSSSMTSGDIGDDSKFTLLTRVKPRFITAPTSASMVNYYRSNLGDSLTTDATTTMSSGRFDVMRESRWHRFRQDFTGPVEIAGNVIDLEPAGDE